MKTLTREDILNSEVFSPPSFDDVLLVPQYTTIKSRLDPDISSYLSPTSKLEVPVISSPMDTVAAIIIVVFAFPA